MRNFLQKNTEVLYNLLAFHVFPTTQSHHKLFDDVEFLFTTYFG